MPDFFRDLRFAFRSLAKSPSFTLAAAAALVLAIGANTAVYSVIHAFLTIPIPIAEPDRVAFVWGENPEKNILQGGLSADDYLDYRERLESFESLTAGAPGQVNVVGAGEPQRVQFARVTPNFFHTAGVAPVLGRAFSDDEGREGADRVAVLTYEFWRSNLGADPRAIGTDIDLDGELHTVIGVAPEDFFFGNPNLALWTPLALERGQTPRDQRALVVYGRLKDGVSVETASAEARTAAEGISVAHPNTHTGWTATVVTVPENLRQGVSFVAILLYACISFVLLIACVNIANLLLARSLAREQEMALRASLGASRMRLASQLLVESLTLAITGGLGGLLVGLAGIRVLRNWIAPDPNVGFIADAIRPETGVILHAIGMSVLAGILFGLIPAFQVSRGALASTLREGGRSGESRRRHVLRSALVMGQVALALALLITAAALIRAFGAIYDADPGFDTANLLTLQVALPEEDYPGPEEITTFFDSTLDQLATLPGVRSVAATTVLPLTQFPGPGNVFAETRSQPADERDQSPNASGSVVSAGYFEAMGIELMRGRTFEKRDRADAPAVAVVSQTFAERFWPETEALGERIRVRFQADAAVGDWIEVVGVVADHRTAAHSLRSPRQPPQLFLPMAQSPQAATSLVVRSATDPLELSRPAREAIWQLDARLPIVQVRTLEQAIAQIDTQNTFFLRILSGLALIALALAAVGIYGIIAYSVHQRTREIGIRTALGAGPGRTIGLVARQAAKLTTVGLVIGCGLAFALVRFMANQLQGIGDTGAGGFDTFGLVCGFFLLVALLASAWPAYRAVRVDPVSALRQE